MDAPKDSKCCLRTTRIPSTDLNWVWLGGGRLRLVDGSACLVFLKTLAQRVLSTHMGNTYPNHKGNYYYRNHTLYHIGTLDPLGRGFTAVAD